MCAGRIEDVFRCAVFRMDIRIQGTISFCSLSTIFWILFLLSQRLTQQYQSKFQGETQHQWMYSLLCTKVLTSYSSFYTFPVQLMLPHTKLCNCISRAAQFCNCTVRPKVLLEYSAASHPIPPAGMFPGGWSDFSCECNAGICIVFLFAFLLYLYYTAREGPLRNLSPWCSQTIVKY